MLANENQEIIILTKCRLINIAGETVNFHRSSPYSCLHRLSRKNGFIPGIIHAPSKLYGLLVGFGCWSIRCHVVVYLHTAVIIVCVSSDNSRTHRKFGLRSLSRAISWLHVGIVFDYMLLAGLAFLTGEMILLFLSIILARLFHTVNISNSVTNVSINEHAKFIMFISRQKYDFSLCVSSKSKIILFFNRKPDHVFCKCSSQVRLPLSTIGNFRVSVRPEVQFPPLEAKNFTERK